MKSGNLRSIIAHEALIIYDCHGFMADFTDEMGWFLVNYCIEFWPILLFRPPIQNAAIIM
jgi:hypothetical protein